MEDGKWEPLVMHLESLREQISIKDRIHSLEEPSGARRGVVQGLAQS